MEYIVHDELEQYSNFLSDLTIGTHRISGKIAAFSSRYRRPDHSTRIPKGRKGHNHPFHNELVIGRDSVQLEGGGPNIPSYLATGLIADNESDNKLQVQKQSTESFGNAAFAASLSNNQGDSCFSIGSGPASTFQPPRRQRSFSLSSCYALRKPARRRTSSLGDLNEPSSRVLLMDMIAALNDSFPDYDFAKSNKEQFRDFDIATALKTINGYLAELGNELSLEKMWGSVDEVVNLKHCEVFSFTPQDDEDYDGFLWYFHYFFFNKDINSLVYFTCAAEPILRHKLESIHESDESSAEVDDFDDYDYDNNNNNNNNEDDMMGYSASFTNQPTTTKSRFDDNDEDERMMIDPAFEKMDENDVDEEDEVELPDYDGII